MRAAFGAIHLTMFDSEISRSSELYNVPESWIRAVISTESSWNPKAYRAEPKINDASYGLMQLLGRTARGLGYNGSIDGLYDPLTNIDLGTKLLGQLRSAYGDDFRRVYSAYNSGNPDLWETSKQVASNVARAVQNLTQWVSTEVQEFASAPASSPMVGLLVVAALFFWTQQQREK